MLGRFSFWKCVRLQRACLCGACLPWCGGGEEWIIDWENRLREQEEKEEEDRVFLRSPESHCHLSLLLFTHTTSKIKKTELLTVQDASLPHSAHFLSCCLDLSSPGSFTFCLIVYAEFSGRFKCSFVPTLSGPFVFVRPCQIQPRFAAFFNAVLFLLRQFSLTNYLTLLTSLDS